MVFDASSLKGFLSRIFERENVFGGRFSLCKKVLEETFAKLVEYGAELIFFFDGSFIQNESLESWMEGADEIYDSQQRVLEMISSGDKTVKSLLAPANESTNRHPFKYNHVSTISVIKAVCESYPKVFTREDYKREREIACFLLNNSDRVIGVFSNNSDFLIFPGQWRYFSTTYLDIDDDNTLTTKEYPRSELRAMLEVNDVQMALIATLSGTSAMDHKKTEFFHRLRNGKISMSVKKTAQLVRTCVTNETKKDDCSRIYFQFMCNLRKHYPHNWEVIHAKAPEECFRECFIKSLDFFVNNKFCSSIESSDSSRNAEEMSNFTYKILNEVKFKIMPHFFDVNQNFGSFEELFIRRYQRQVGVIMKMNSVNRKFTVVSRFENEEKCRVVHVDPEFPPQLSENFINDNASDSERFEVLKWILSMENIKIELETFPDDYTIHILTIAFLFMKNAITRDEMNLLLWTSVAFINQLISEKLTVKETDVVHPRAFALTHLYMSTYKYISGCTETCGLKRRLRVSGD